jgi:hypothetical protein
MFYCDKCAKENKYPRMAQPYRSLGPCELCDKVSACTDLKGEVMEEAGDVVLYPTTGKEVFKQKGSCFKAPKGKIAIFGFDLAEIWRAKEDCLVAVNLVKEFAIEKKPAAAKQILKLRESAKREQMYFLYDDKGNILKLK